jgi:hypothetical protein
VAAGPLLNPSITPGAEIRIDLEALLNQGSATELLKQMPSASRVASSCEKDDSKACVGTNYAHKSNMTAAKLTQRKWVRKVKTVSTYLPKDLFTKDAETIARAMASKKVSPKGIGSGIRMIQFFINRAGKTLPIARERVLEHAKQILRKRLKAK